MTKDEMAAADARAALEYNRIQFEVPNLTDLSTDPLDYAAMERVLDRLSLYCHNKRHAMNLRKAGDIEAAQHFEKSCEFHYALLPKWARW